MVNQHSVATETEDETAGEIANAWEVLGRTSANIKEPLHKRGNTVQ
jgi:hypothetical protein